MAWVRIALLALFMALCCSASAQQPGKRVALIIANSAYEGQIVLPNPPVDAVIIQAALTKAGFEVRIVSDLNKIKMQQELLSFRRETQGASAALVYFSGHGIRIGRTNYLLPVDFDASEITTETDFDLFAYSHNAILQALAGAQAKIAVFDACRDNPYDARLRLASRPSSRSADGGGSGLGEVEPGDALVVYSAGAGQFALDGVTGQGSPFAQAFAKNVVLPGVDFGVLVRFIRRDVARATTDLAEPQKPFFAGSLGDDPLVLVASGEAPSTELRLNLSDFGAWLAADSARAEQVAALEMFLRERNVAGVAPTWQLIGSSGASSRGLPTFTLPPRELWPNIVPALEFIRDHVKPILGDIEVTSVYRSDQLNSAFHGNPRSRHVRFAAIDLITKSVVAPTQLTAALCEAHAAYGEASGIGLGFHSQYIFHIQAGGAFNAWREDRGRIEQACKSPQ